MKEMVLLGAGASVEAGIPTARKATEKLYSVLRNKVMRDGRKGTEDAYLLLFLARGMMNHRVRTWVADRFGMQTMNSRSVTRKAIDLSNEPFHPDVDIEELYSAVELLDEGDKIQHAAFFQLDEWVKAVNWPDAYKSLAEIMRRETARMMVINDSRKVDYLSPIVELSRRQPGVTVANLNWDNAIELLAKTNGVSANTGLSEWSQKREFRKQTEGITLLKLHGSCTWKYSTEKAKGYPLSHDVVQEVADTEQLNFDKDMPSVIFGLRGKLTAKGPFLDLLRAFREHLSSADRLTIIGYSFRDAHINAPIKEWLISHTDKKLIVVDPGFEKSTESFAKELREEAKDRVKVIHESCCDVQAYTRAALKEWLEHIQCSGSLL